MSLISMMSYVVEIGPLDICLVVSTVYSHLALPREGRLHQVFHRFAYLKKINNMGLVYDPSDPVVDESAFEKND